MGFACLEVEYRLVDDDELVALERGLDVADDACVHSSTEVDGLVGRIPLRRVHLAIRAREQLTGRGPVRREDGPADAAVDLHRRALDAERPAKRVPYPPDQGGGLCVVSRAEREDDELVASDASHGVACTHDSLEAACKRPKDCVAGTVTANVVDVLEAVQIDEDERERLPVSPRSSERLLDAIVEKHPVREPGERVAEGVRAHAVESPVENDSAQTGHERDHQQGADDTVGRRAECDRRRPTNEDERCERERPCERSA